MAERDLEDMEYAVEVGREHAPPFVLRAVDEGALDVGPDAGIGEAPVDPAEDFDGRAERVLDRGAIGHVADSRLDRRPERGKLGERGAILLRIAAPDRDCAAGARERPGHAEADSAIAAGDDRRPARQIEITRHR